jgi:ribose transport system substrate-binding protein
MSQEIAVNLITQGVVGIFGTNEGGTTGVGNAIAESSRKVIGVGFDKSDAILEHIRSGNLLCTMAQNPYVMGYEGIKSAAKVLKGEALDSAVLDTGVSVIDAATVDN